VAIDDNDALDDDDEEEERDNNEKDDDDTIVRVSASLLSLSSLYSLSMTPV